MYALRSGDDPIRYANLIQAFGPDPELMGVQPDSGIYSLSVDGQNVADGTYRDEESGHSQYPQMGDNHLLRISGYQFANIIAGNKSDLIMDNGDGSTSHRQR